MTDATLVQGPWSAGATTALTEWTSEPLTADMVREAAEMAVPTPTLVMMSPKECAWMESWLPEFFCADVGGGTWTTLDQMRADADAEWRKAGLLR